MRINDIAHPEARAWLHGYLASHNMDRAAEPYGFDEDVEEHLYDLIADLCPYPMPEIRKDHP